MWRTSYWSDYWLAAGKSSSNKIEAWRTWLYQYSRQNAWHSAAEATADTILAEMLMPLRLKGKGGNILLLWAHHMAE